MALFDYSIFCLLFQEAYAFWTCSTHLPMWLLDYDSERYVEVEACRSTCLMVEKRCPFLIKGTEDDMASGNPSFMCKGKGKEKTWQKLVVVVALPNFPLFFCQCTFYHWLFCQCNDSLAAEEAAAEAPPTGSLTVAFKAAAARRSTVAAAAELEIPNCQPRYTTLAIPDKAVGSYCTPRQILAENKKLSGKLFYFSLVNSYGFLML